MHAVDQINASSLLAIIAGAIIFVVVFTAIFKKKRK